MRKLFTILLFLIAATTARAQNCSGEVLALQALYDTRNVMLRGGSSYDVTQRLEEHLDRLRGPLPEGGYEWVRWMRPAGDGPVEKKSHLSNAEYQVDELETFEASANVPFSVRITVPRKRSLRKANKEVFVDTLSVHYWVNGQERVMEKTVNQWLRPNTSKTFDLGAVADRATASASVATRASNLGEALVEIHFLQAVAEDDPSGPNYDSIQRLKRLAGYVDARTVDDEIARLEARLFGTTTSLPMTLLMEQLRQADTLIRSKKPEDQEKGRQLVEETIRLIR